MFGILLCIRTSMRAGTRVRRLGRVCRFGENLKMLRAGRPGWQRWRAGNNYTISDGILTEIWFRSVRRTWKELPHHVLNSISRSHLPFRVLLYHVALFVGPKSYWSGRYHHPPIPRQLGGHFYPCSFVSMMDIVYIK